MIPHKENPLNPVINGRTESFDDICGLRAPVDIVTEITDGGRSKITGCNITPDSFFHFDQKVEPTMDVPDCID
tara:strand:- start:3426 stop:3644 length:219 start_codon:yes stop_codon:yes gene_type:complete